MYKGAKGNQSLSILAPRVYAVIGAGVLTEKELNPHPIINAFGKIGIVSFDDGKVIGFVDITKDEAMCRPALLAFPNHCTKNQPLFGSQEEAITWATKWVDDRLEEQLIEARYRAEWVKKRLDGCHLTIVEGDPAEVQQVSADGNDKINSLRDIKEWTDCDGVEFEFMVMLGLIDPVKSPFASKAKHVFWSANDVGTAVHEMMETFVRLGMLEKREEPDLQYRWNQEYKGTWE
jgi:hypothetical protein